MPRVITTDVAGHVGGGEEYHEFAFSHLSALRVGDLFGRSGRGGYPCACRATAFRFFAQATVHSMSLLIAVRLVRCSRLA